MKLDVLVRYHKSGNLSYLEESLRSIIVSSFADIHIILGCQDVEPSAEKTIRSFFDEDLNRIPKEKNRTLSVFHVRTNGNEDRRAVLFKEGLQRRNGDFFASLDYDDVIYEFAYDLLISKFKSENVGLVAGGLHKAIYVPSTSGEMCVEKFGYNKRKYFQYELVHHNFLPLHCYVIRGKFIDQLDLGFLEDLSMFEDYALLLKLSAICKFDFSLQDCPVGEYRFRKHLPNSTQAIQVEGSVRDQWVHCYKIVEKMKKEITIEMSFADLKQILASERRNAHRELGYEFFDFSKFDPESTV